MDKIWEFFENMDELVYVSDVNTHQLVYMNQLLRESLGFHAHEDYRGKMCYEILQGCHAPCSFCTNQFLEEGKFVSWTHKNPVLKKRFLIKDTLIHLDENDYRIELAIDADSEASGKSAYYYARSETILNECLQKGFSGADPSESLRNLLAYIGSTFSCDRCYIFELSGQSVNNTYEWCADGVSPQKDLLQNVPISTVSWWIDLFAQQEITLIPNLEDIRSEYPESYAVLKPQNITSLAAGPITVDDEIIGFLGVDNPDSQMMMLIEPLLKVIGYFVSTLLRRRDLMTRLGELSYHDQLTGAFNRHALAEHYETFDAETIGVIYCDITGLKQVNDSQGHEAGDQLICRCHELLRGIVHNGNIYRAGGDEFIALCPNCTKEDFLSSVSDLQSVIRQDGYHIAVGYVWSDRQPLELENLIMQADQIMYQDKRQYYLANAHRADIDRRRPPSRHVGEGSEGATPFQSFLSTIYYDAESQFQSASQDNETSYFYFGDMQKDLFYISDNMRDAFGFQSNVVPGLLQQWAKRISTPEFQDLYWQEISGMLREKRSLHDLRYQVRDVRGNNLWIRCYGILKWNEDKTAPLFFSGRVTHQDNTFVVDPITNFPREHAAFSQLSDLCNGDEKTLIIGFRLNGITEINSTKGRVFGDHLLKKVSDRLMEQLSWKMSFYRLEGMRCMAIVHPICQVEGAEALVDQIRSVVKECYDEMDVSVQNVCSFGLIEYPCSDFTPEDLVENLISLIRVAKQDAVQSYADYSEKSVERIRWMANMTLALNQDVQNHMKNFRIVVQPVVSTADGRPIGGEVLLRWSFEGRDVSPGIFIPILEKENLIHLVGRWVFEQAVCTCVRIHAYDPAFYLTFNVSLHQLTDTQFLPIMKQTLETYGLEGASLVAELTESCLDEQPEKLAHFVEECQKMGLRIALDDFGSGYSSLRMLLQYPSGIIKLDRSLVEEASESESKLNFIRSIVYACHQFGKTVCMEGVERPEQNEMILSTGCDMIQGYYYYRPMEVSDIYQLVSRQQENSAKE